MAATLPGQTSQLGDHNSDGIFAGHSALDDILSVGHAPVRTGMPPAGHSPMNAGNISSNGSNEHNAGPPSSVESNASGVYHMGSMLSGSVQSDLHAPANTRVGTITNGDTFQRQNTLGGKRNPHGSGLRRSARITVQDLESRNGDTGNTVMMLTPPTLDDLLMMVSSRLGYKQKHAKLYSKFGAIIDDITLIRDDDLLFSSDGGDFPSHLRSNGEALDPDASIIGTTARSKRKAGEHQQVELDRFDIWGWPRICQIVGAERVRYRLYQSWRTSGAAGSLLLIINFVAFLFPPTCVGRGVCSSQLSEYEGEHSSMAVQAYFWFFALATLSATLCVIVAATLTLQLNLVSSNRDIFWFLKEYGNWLVGYPTTFLVVTVTMMFGGILSSAVLNYDLPVDANALIGVYVSVGAVLIAMSLVVSARSWARVNGMPLTKVWPDDPYPVEIAQSSNTPARTNSGAASQKDSPRSGAGGLHPISAFQSNTSSAVSQQMYVNSSATAANVSSSSPTGTIDEEGSKKQQPR